METNVWLVGLFCTALGALAGYAVAAMFGTGSQRTRDLEDRLQQARDELKNYRLDVNAHFTRTAELANQFNSHYREMHNHLARGAQTLCDRPGQPPLMHALPEQPVYASPEEALPLLQDVRPPLDYAPKATPSERGVLSEDFGLDKPLSPRNVTMHYDFEGDPTIPRDDEDDTDPYTGLSSSKN